MIIHVTCRPLIRAHLAHCRRPISCRQPARALDFRIIARRRRRLAQARGVCAIVSTTPRPKSALAINCRARASGASIPLGWIVIFALQREPNSDRAEFDCRLRRPPPPPTFETFFSHENSIGRLSSLRATKFLLNYIAARPPRCPDAPPRRTNPICSGAPAPSFD